MAALSKEVLSAVVAAARSGNTRLARAIANGEVPFTQAVVSRGGGERAAAAARRAASEASQARSLDLESRLLRRWQGGRPVPEWFRPWEGGDRLLRYQQARASSGQAGLSGVFPSARFGGGSAGVPLAAAKARNEAVRKSVSATDIPMDKIKNIQRLCGVQDNPMVCAKVSDMIEREIGYIKQMGFWRGRQHAWNVRHDGTVVDATASQFGLPSINIVPGSVARSQGYKGMTPQQVRYAEEANLQGFPLSNEDWWLSRMGRDEYEIDPWIAEGLDFDDVPWESPWAEANRIGQRLSDFYMMPYGQQTMPRLGR